MTAGLANERQSFLGRQAKATRIFGHQREQEAAVFDGIPGGGRPGTRRMRLLDRIGMKGKQPFGRIG